MSDLLLDTCAMLWLANGEKMSETSRNAIPQRGLHISPIGDREIADLARKNRIAVLAYSRAGHMRSVEC